MIPALITATATVIVAVLTGWVATRNARKTPHETIATLLNATEKAEGLDDGQRQVLADAVASEVGRLRAIYDAERRGPISYLLLRIKQSDPIFLFAVVTAIVALAVATTTGIIVAQRTDEKSSAGHCTNKNLAAVPSGLPLTVGGGIANVTRGDTSYVPASNTKVDDVLKFEAHYSKGVGSPAVDDLGLHITIHQQGQETTITAVLGGPSGPRYEASASVVMSTPQSQLIYIPGSARWCNGTLPQTISLPDSIVTSTEPQPFTNLSESSAQVGGVTVLLRSVATAMSFRVECRTERTPSWSQDCAAQPGETIDTGLVLRNVGNLPINSVVVRLLPSSNISGPQSKTTVSDGSAADRDAVGTLDGVDGATIGDIAVGATATARTSLTIANTARRGDTLTVRGSGRGLGMNTIENSMKIHVQ